MGTMGYQLPGFLAFRLPSFPASRLFSNHFIDGMSSSAAVKKLVEKDIAVRNGHFYAVRCLEALGIQDTTEGIVRISLVHYNAEEEVSRLVDGLGEL